MLTGKVDRKMDGDKSFHGVTGRSCFAITLLSRLYSCDRRGRVCDAPLLSTRSADVRAEVNADVYSRLVDAGPCPARQEASPDIPRPGCLDRSVQVCLS